MLLSNAFMIFVPDAAEKYIVYLFNDRYDVFR